MRFTKRAAPVAGCMSVLVLTLLGGCTSALNLPGATSRPADPARSNVFAPVSRPADFDESKAMMPLASVPGDPLAPEHKAGAESAGLPAPALRYLEESRRLFAEQRYTETILEVEKVLRYNPKSPDAHRLMALACLFAGNEARARLSAEKTLAVRPADLASHYVLGRFADKAGNREEAMRRYRLALKSEETPADKTYRLLAQHHLGVLLESDGYYAAAAEELRAYLTGVEALGDSVADNPELATLARVQGNATAIRLARIEGLIGRYAEAADALRGVVARAPKDIELRSEYVRMLGRAGRADEAMAEAARLVADSRGDASAVELLQGILKASDNPEKGVDTLRSLIEQHPDAPALRLVLADALVSAKRRDQAIEVLKDLIARDRSSPDAGWKLIDLYAGEKQWAEWLDAMAAQLAAHPTETRGADGRFEQIPEAAARKLAESRMSAAVTATAPEGESDVAGASRAFVLGRLLQRLGRGEDAAALFAASARLAPGFTPTTVGVAQARMRDCAWQEAITLLEAATSALKEPTPQLERLLGQCYDALDRTEEAIKHYEKATQGDSPEAVQAKFELGRLYDRTGQPALAQRQYRAAMSADPSSMRAREALVHALLAGIAPGQAAADQQASLTRVLAELKEMQRLAPEDPATTRVTALVKFLSTRDRDAYRGTIRDLVEHYPDDFRSREELAKILFEFRDYAGVRSHSAELLARDPGSANAAEMMVLATTRMLELEEAGAQYKRMLACHPSREAWLRQFCELRLNQQQYDEAIELCNRLLALTPVKENPDRLVLYRLRMLQILREARRVAPARELAEAWLKTAGENERHRRVYRAIVLSTDAAAGDLDRYLERCRTWLKESPDSSELRRWLLSGLVEAKRHEEAAVLALTWMASAPDSDELYGALADVLAASTQKDGAVELIRSQLAASTSQEERLNRLLVMQAAYLKAGRYKEAADAGKELISASQNMISPGFVFKLRQSLARVLTQAGQYDEAISLVNSMLQDLQRGAEEGANAEERSELLRLLSVVHQRQNRFDLAEQRLREAHELTPDDVGVNNDLGYTLADSGREIAEARRMIRTAVGEEIRQIAYLDSYGWVLYKAGEFDQARVWLHRAATTLYEGPEQMLTSIVANPAAVAGPEDAVIYDHLGDAQWRLGEKKAAGESWKKSQEVYERQVAAGEEPVDPDLAERLKKKIAAVAADGEPPVAPLAPASKPAP